VQAVLGLVPDGGLVAVEHVGGDLLAGMGGEAVEDDGAVGGGGEEVGVQLVRGKGGLLWSASASAMEIQTSV
jgi:hypothetical protein